MIFWNRAKSGLENMTLTLPVYCILHLNNGSDFSTVKNRIRVCFFHCDWHDEKIERKLRTFWKTGWNLVILLNICFCFARSLKSPKTQRWKCQHEFKLVRLDKLICFDPGRTCYIVILWITGGKEPSLTWNLSSGFISQTFCCCLKQQSDPKCALLWIHMLLFPHHKLQRCIATINRWTDYCKEVIKATGCHFKINC